METTANDLFFVNIVSSTDGSSFNKNFLLVSLEDAISDRNKTSYFSNPSDDTEWTNFTDEMSGKAWIGIRYVFRRNNLHVLIEIHEMYPVHGRIWSNFYNSDLRWQGWKSITPQ